MKREIILMVCPFCLDVAVSAPCYAVECTGDAHNPNTHSKLKREPVTMTIEHDFKIRIEPKP